MTDRITSADFQPEARERDWCARCFRDYPTEHEIAQGTMGEIDATIEECRTCGGLFVQHQEED